MMNLHEEFENLTIQRELEAENNYGMVSATIVFTLAAFIANCGQTVTGFGMAMLFWSVFTIADFIGLMKSSAFGVKEAAFFQALSLASVSPLLLWQTREIIQKHASKTLLTAFIPATLIGTPIGQLLQEVVKAEIVRLIVGVSILLVSIFEVIRLIKIHKKERRDDSSSDEHEEPERKDGDLEETDNSEKSEIVAFRQNSQANNPEANVLKTESITDEESLQRTTIRIAMPREEDEEDVFKPNHASGSKFWILGFLLGFLSGFLGGLSGLRSGPILIFFLHFDYPKPIIRANLMIVTCVNTYVRIIYYLIEDVAGTNSVVWFERDFWYLYVCIIIAGLLGVPLGSRLEAKINQTRYNSIIVAALIIAGSMSMIKGSIDISKLKNR